MNEAQAQGQPKQFIVGIASCSTAATDASQIVAAASGGPQGLKLNPVTEA